MWSEMLQQENLQARKTQEAVSGFESEIQGINGRDREIRSNCESVESRESLGSTDVI